MKAILLAAGYGRRLSPITNNTPKCLLPVGGVAMLDHWMIKLSELGVTEFLINTHYLADQVKNHILKSRFRTRVSITYERQLFGTAGTLNINRDFLEGDDGFLVHVDNYCDDPLNGMIEAHANRPKNKEVTVLVFESKTPQECGIFELDEYGEILRFYEKVPKPPGNLANGAVFLLSETFVKSAILGDTHDFSREVISSNLKKLNLYKVNGFFADIGTPVQYRAVCKHVEGVEGYGFKSYGEKSSPENG